MKNGERLPTTTALQSRIQLFQATHSPVFVDEEYTTAWGSCRVRGRLGERHQDALESMMFLSPHRAQDGRILLLVDPAQTRRSISAKGYSGSGLETLINDLTAAVIIIKTKEVQTTGHLIDTWRKSTVTAKNPLPMGGGQRNLWAVTVGDALVELMKKDLVFHREPGVIPRLRFGISKAVVRHLLTHKFQPKGGWKTDELISCVAAGLSVVSRRNRRRELRQEQEGIEKCGFRLVGDRLMKIE